MLASLKNPKSGFKRTDVTLGNNKAANIKDYSLIFYLAFNQLIKYGLKFILIILVTYDDLFVKERESRILVFCCWNTVHTRAFLPCPFG